MNVVTVPLPVKCPKCGEEFERGFQLTHDDLVPKTCSGIRPRGHATYYEITSGDIQTYLQEKVRSYDPDAQIIVNPMYTEAKQKEDWELHRAYAVVNVAFSANLIEDPIVKAGVPDWLIQSLGGTKVVKAVADEVIKRYKLNPEDFNRDYRHAEQNAHQFGITNSFSDAVKRLLTPQSVSTKDGAIWVIVALSAAKIIADMLASKATKKLPGDMFIQDVRKISNNMVNFSVFVRDGMSSVARSADPNITALVDNIIKGKA